MFVLQERESVVRNQQQRLSTLELETDKMRDELQNKLWSLEERHRQALEEVRKRSQVMMLKCSTARLEVCFAYTKPKGFLFELAGTC